MLSAEKIQLNWDRYISEIKTNISKERTDILIPFMEKYQERMMMMPAAAKNWHHSAFAGGYVDHVLRVYDCANELYKTWKKMGGDISTYTIEEMHFVALFHDLGKMGQQEGEYYQPNDSQWHIDKLGQIYKFNTDIPGLYDESNKFYFMSGMKETKLRSHLPLLMHQADHMAAQVEFEIWNNATNAVPKQSKPINGSKGDKTIRNAKKINTENNPNLSNATLDVIDSFFKD
jgi:hypothetical protein